jgi:hypothetical protein
MHALSLLLLQLLYLSLSWWLQYYYYTGSDFALWLLFTEFTCMWVLVCTEPSFPGRIRKFDPPIKAPSPMARSTWFTKSSASIRSPPRYKRLCNSPLRPQLTRWHHQAPGVLHHPLEHRPAEIKETSQNHAPTVWIDLRHLWFFMSCTTTWLIEVFRKVFFPSAPICQHASFFGSFQLFRFQRLH